MNRVVHFEIPADDMERAKKFYSENFGWKLTQLGPEMGSYVLVQTGPTDEKGMPQDRAFINGGLMKREPSASGSWSSPSPMPMRRSTRSGKPAAHSSARSGTSRTSGAMPASGTPRGTLSA